MFEEFYRVAQEGTLAEMQEVVQKLTARTMGPPKTAFRETLLYALNGAGTVLKDTYDEQLARSVNTGKDSSEFQTESKISLLYKSAYCLRVAYDLAKGKDFRKSVAASYKGTFKTLNAYQADNPEHIPPITLKPSLEKR